MFIYSCVLLLILYNAALGITGAIRVTPVNDYIRNLVLKALVIDDNTEDFFIFLLFPVIHLFIYVPVLVA